MSRTLGALLTLTFLGSVAASAAAGQDAAPEIDRAEVERVLRVLADDAMLGRAAFRPEAMRAARFLASEFEAAGLDPLPGEDDYLQTFHLPVAATGAVTLVLDGRRIPADAVRLRAGTARLEWATGDAPISVIGPNADARARLVEHLRSGASALVLLHPAHAGLMDALSRSFRSPSPGRPGGGALVVALAEGSAASEYTLTATSSVDQVELANVVGVVPGRRADELVVFGAHYDHVAPRPVAEDSIFNGANDNASGTAAVVALARHFASRGVPERTLVFVAFTAEESGGLGSRRFAEGLDPDRVVAMFNIEMIGKPAVEGPGAAWITGFERSTFGEILQEAVVGTAYSFHPDPYPEQNLFYRSDNTTLARLGVPAHSISTTPIDVDRDYHRPSDEVETLDLDHLTNTIRAIALGATPIVSGEATPSRVDPATVER